MLVAVWMLASVSCKAWDEWRAERDLIVVGKAKVAVARRMLEKREIATMLNSGEMEDCHRARSLPTLCIDPNTEIMS